MPCRDQERKWSVNSKIIYRDILSNKLCTKKLVTPGFYTPTCMQKRNEWMVDNCDVLIAVWDGTSGGTGNCVKYAKQKGFVENDNLIIINPKNCI